MLGAVGLPTSTGLQEGIVLAAIQLGAESGEEGLTMRAIAAQLGISVTTIYQHFDSKASILREIRFVAVDLLNRALVDAQSDADASVRLGEMSRAYIRFSRSNPWLYQLMFDAEEIDWSTMPPDERFVALAPIQTTAANFVAGVVQGTFRADLDVAEAVLLTWASLHGIASLLLRGRLSDTHPAFPAPDVASFLEAFVVHLVRGFRR